MNYSTLQMPWWHKIIIYPISDPFHPNNNWGLNRRIVERRFWNKLMMKFKAKRNKKPRKTHKNKSQGHPRIRTCSWVKMPIFLRTNPQQISRIFRLRSKEVTFTWKSKMNKNLRFRDKSKRNVKPSSPVQKSIELHQSRKISNESKWRLKLLIDWFFSSIMNLFLILSERSTKSAEFKYPFVKHQKNLNSKINNL